MTEEQTNDLFALYKATGDVAVRNKIAEKYLYIADILAKKFAHRGVEYDDLKQVASYALLRGIDRFDPDLGMQFTTFITPTIAGEIKNYFRDKSRMVKLPRKLGEQSARVKAFFADFEAKNGVKPSVKEIAEALEYSEEDVVKALEVGGTLSLDRMAANEEDDNRSLHDLLPAGRDEYEEFETREALRAAMSDFKDVEKRLIKYRFVDQLSQSKTAEKLDVSQMFVSRMEKRLILRLRERLSNSL